MGRVVGGHGVRGTARVNPFNPDSPALADGKELILVPEKSGNEKTFLVRTSRRHKRVFLVDLEGIDNLDELTPWIGSEVQVPASALPKVGDESHYHWEVIGLEVHTRAGDFVGRIEEILALPANDLWVVRDGDRESLVPVVDEIVCEVDLLRGIATIDPPAGLIAEG